MFSPRVFKLVSVVLTIFVVATSINLARSLFYAYTLKTSGHRTTGVVTGLTHLDLLSPSMVGRPIILFDLPDGGMQEYEAPNRMGSSFDVGQSVDLLVHPELCTTESCEHDWAVRMDSFGDYWLDSLIGLGMLALMVAGLVVVTLMRRRQIAAA